MHYLLLGVVSMTAQAADGPVGYTDTPMIPGQKWRVHDKNRPIPKIVTPGTTFSHSAPAPSDAIILFDGKDLSKWRNGNKPATWKVENGFMEVTPGSGSIQTKDDFGDFQLHLEFATPHQVEGDSQGRGNSGVIIYGKYEVQVLDSFNNRILTPMGKRVPCMVICHRWPMPARSPGRGSPMTLFLRPLAGWTEK